MAKDPAFLFYTNDFTSGTQFFTDEQVGKYIRLLLAQHQHGHLSENQVIMICKSYDNHIMSKFTKDSGGNWYNERLEIEIEKRKKFSESRSKNKKGKKIISKSYDPHMENENSIYVFIDNNNNTNENRKNQFPTLENYNIELTETGRQRCIETYMLRNTVLLSAEHIDKIFQSFKIQRLTGKNFYETPEKFIDHFTNWLPQQKIKNGSERKSTAGARDENGKVIMHY